MSDWPRSSLKISPRHFTIFVTVAVMTIVLFGCLTWYTWSTFKYIEISQKNYFRIHELRGSIVHLDEVLTMSVRMAAATGEQVWEERYRRHEEELDDAIKEAVVLSLGFSLEDAAEKIDTANRKLVGMENRAFDLVRKGKTKEAAVILSSAEYDLQKEIYTSGVRQITETIRENLEKSISEHRSRGYLAIGSTLIITPCLILGWILVAALILQDNTNRKQAEEKLRQTEGRIQHVIAASRSIVYSLTPGFAATWIAPNVESILGYSLAESMAPGWWTDHLHADDRQRILAEMPRLFENDRHVHEYRFRFKDGSYHWVNDDLRLIRDAKGNPTEIVGSWFDITERKQAEKTLVDTLETLRNAVGTTIQVLVTAVEIRDPYTAGHQIRSADLARAIATEMGLPPEKIEGLRMAASIHDIGKLSIPAEILSKPTKLSDIEFSLIKAHAQRGFEMLKDVKSPWPLAEIVFQHHERMDGTGYPRNLKGEEICLEARILAVADVVEAMASHRPYRPGFGIEAALSEIEKNKGIFYDNAVVDACMRLFRERGFQLAMA